MGYNEEEGDGTLELTIKRLYFVRPMDSPSAIDEYMSIPGLPT